VHDVAARLCVCDPPISVQEAGQVAALHSWLAHLWQCRDSLSFGAISQRAVVRVGALGVYALPNGIAIAASPSQRHELALATRAARASSTEM
jgi:hypothetical protein